MYKVMYGYMQWLYSNMESELVMTDPQFIKTFETLPEAIAAISQHTAELVAQKAWMGDMAFELYRLDAPDGLVVESALVWATGAINKGEMFEMLMSTYGMCGYPTEPVLFTGLVALSDEYKRGR